MLGQLLEARVQCPHCWEHFDLVVDGSIESQQYIEDCEICCRPIDFDVAVDGLGEARVRARRCDL